MAEISTDPMRPSTCHIGDDDDLKQPPPPLANDNNKNDNKDNHNNAVEEQQQTAIKKIMNIPKLVQTFHDDGFITIPQVLRNQIPLLKQWHAFANAYFDQCFETLYKNGYTSAPVHYDSQNNNANNHVLGLGAKHGFREIVMRSPGRYELSLLDYNDGDFPVQTMMQQTLEPLSELLPALLLGSSSSSSSSMEELKCCHVSLLVATSNATDQGWHADGGHVNLQKHLPCHVYNVFIPLQDVPLDMGPTEFRPASHYLTRNLGPMMLAAKCRKTLRTPVWEPWTLGDVVIFDYRILHRGRANTSSSSTTTGSFTCQNNNTNNNNHHRTMLVFTFCEPWFHDVLNFPKRSMMEPNQESNKKPPLQEKQAQESSTAQST